MGQQLAHFIWAILQLPSDSHFIGYAEKMPFKTLIARDTSEIFTEIYCFLFVMYLHSKVILVARKHVV